MKSEAKSSIRRNISFLKHKLRGASTAVMEQIMISYIRSLLIYFGTPMIGAGLW